MTKHTETHGAYESWPAFWQHMSSPPSEDILRVNKYANNAKYIGIERYEALLRRDFCKFEATVRNLVVRDGQVHIAMRLVLHLIIGGEWQTLNLDGVNGQKCASPDKDTARAKSFAFKNALKSLGNRYGGGLNREWEDTTEYIDAAQASLDTMEACLVTGYSEATKKEFLQAWNVYQKSEGRTSARDSRCDQLVDEFKQLKDREEAQND